MKNFIIFVENNKQLKELKLSIYKDINTCGWFGTSSYYHRFIPLFESMRRHYINENQMTGAGDVIKLSTKEIRDFCQHFVNEYESVKNVYKNLVM